MTTATAHPLTAPAEAPDKGVGCGELVQPLHWPCPNGCMNWARAWNLHEPQTNHHPRCEYVDTSLIDVWTARIPGETGGCVTDNEANAREMATEDPDEPLEVIAGKMHREIFEQLGEFNGF